MRELVDLLQSFSRAFLGVTLVVMNVGGITSDLATVSAGNVP